MLLAFDQYLAEKRLQFDAVVIGGAALNLLGVVSRLTKDCDILHPRLPRPRVALPLRSGPRAARFKITG